MKSSLRGATLIMLSLSSASFEQNSLMLKDVDLDIKYYLKKDKK